MKILTYGATGVQGGGVAKALAQTDHTVYALVREPDNLGEFADQGIIPIKGDLEDRASLDAASQGMDRVIFHLPLAFDREAGLNWARNVLEAAKAAGVELVIFNSGSIVPPGQTPYLHLELKRLIIEMAREIGQPMISLKPRLYYETLQGPWVAQGIKEQSTLAYAMPTDHKVSWITVDDIGKIAVACLNRLDLAGQEIEVGGPDALTGTELAATFSRALGREISYYPITASDFEKSLQQSLNEQVGTVVAESFYYFESVGPNGMAIDTAVTTANDLGVTLTPLQDWIESQSWD